MEEESIQMKEAFQVRVMDEIKTLTAKIEELQMNLTSVSQRLFDHLDTCPQGRSSDVTGVQLRPKEGRRWRRRSEDHRRTCLRKALQNNVVLLVDSLPFTESELGDMLISAGCLTEDECGDLKRHPMRKDHTRNLVRLIKGRSFKVMTDFLNCVQQISPDIARLVWETYQGNLKNHSSQSACTFCSLRHSVDIKLLADHVFSIEAISDSLYDEIVSCDHPDESHWHKMAKECLNSDHPQKAMDIICKTLERKGHYKELVVRLRREKTLECCCYKQKIVPIIVVDEIPSAREDDVSSISPTSSVHLGDLPTSDISSYEDLTEMPYTEKRDNAMDFQRQFSYHAHVTNLNLLRVRSNSFGKTSAVSNSWSRRRASMIN